MFSTSPKKRIPKLSEVHQFWTLDSTGKRIIEFLSSLPKITPSLDDTRLEDIQLPPCGPVENINPENAPVDRFMDGNNDRLLDFSFSQLNDVYGAEESKGLPPGFVANLCLNRIFTESWEDADLTHALTGLDYLTNLECTRKTALREVAQRLRITEDNWQTVLGANQKAKDWIVLIQEQEEHIELCYSCLWVDLRIWTMVKELRSEPFYKPNVIAMLNTLFPVAKKELPSLRITASIMRHYRSTFYRFLVAVANDGKMVLNSFIEKINRPGTGHTWSDTRQTLQDYINLADSMINQASQIYGIAFFKILPRENLSLRTPRFSGTPSNHSDRASGKSRKTQMSNDGSQPGSTKASGDGSNAENSSSLRSSLNSNNSPGSPDSRFSPPSRAKISGRNSGHTISSQGDVKKLFQDSPQVPWYTSPPRQSSPSVNSLETAHSGGRLQVISFSRPLTPSIERPRDHRRSSSANRRISYDFRNALPGTPELPSPQAADKRIVSKGSFATQTTVSSESEAIVKDHNETQNTESKKKKSGLSLFRKKKKLEIPPEFKPTIALHQDEGSYNVTPSRDDFDKLSPPDGRLFVPEEQLVKKKSSFRFLQRQKSHENNRAFSDSNSERTVTPIPTRRIKPRRSLTNIFANKVGTTNGLGIDVNESGRGDTKTITASSGLRQTIRKVRSHGSVRSASSIYSSDGIKNTPTSGTSPMFEEDRVVTSADIDEPFPFRNFTPLQTPAQLFENPREQKEIEAVRKSLLEKAQKERMAKWHESEELKRKLEASRQKRKVLREEMDASVHLSKIVTKKQVEQEEKKKSKQASANPGPKTAKAGAHGSDKPPKTPLKERVIKELAYSYSPKSP